jgi:hypothetical protein
MTRECAIAAIVGLIVLTSLLTIGGFPPAIAVAITFTGATGDTGGAASVEPSPISGHAKVFPSRN